MPLQNQYFFQAMEKLDRAILSAGSLENMLSGVLQLMLDLFDCDRVWLIRPCNPDAPSWQIYAEKTRPGFTGLPNDRRWRPMHPYVAEKMRQALQTRHPCHTGRHSADDIGIKTDTKPALSQLFIAVFPKIDQPWLLGIHFCRETKKPSGHDELLLDAIAKRLADGLTRFLSLNEARSGEERFRFFAELTSDWFWETDRNMRYSYLSGAYADLFGTPAETILEEPFRQEENTLSPPPDEGEPQTLTEYLQRRLPFHDLEVSRVLPTGEKCFFALSGEPIIDESGNFVGFRGTGRSITDAVIAERRARRRASEEEALTKLMRLTLEETSTITFLERAIDILLDDVPWLGLLPKAGIFLTRKKAGKETLEPAVHKNMDDSLLRLCRNVAFGQCLCGRAAASQRIQHAECVDHRHETRYAGMKDHGHYNVPILAQGRTIGVIVLYLPEGHGYEKSAETFLSRVADTLSLGITARRTQAALRQAKEEAEFANRAKTQFLANMSHELRTPLNAIIGFADILSAELFGPLGNERYREYARDIANSGGHLLAIISDLLDVAKIEAGAFEINDEDVSPEQAVSVTLQLLRVQAEKAQLTLSQRFPADFPRLRGDPLRLRQIIVNLVSNAIKFTPEGGSICVEGRLHESGGIVIEISDTGIGMAAEDIPKALEPFGQVHDIMSRPHEGTGLGLHMSKTMMEMHGGQLLLESTPGEGTTITLLFPPERTIATASDEQQKP